MADGLRVRKAFVSKDTNDVVRSYENKIFDMKDVNYYRELFEEFKLSNNVDGNFEDDKWKVHGLHRKYIYSFEHSFHKEFNTALKCFALLEFHENKKGHNSVNARIRTIQKFANITGMFSILNFDYLEDDLNNKKSNRRYDIACQLISFLSFYHINDFKEYIEELSLVSSSTKYVPRKLPNYPSILLFDYIVDDFYSKCKHYDKLLYFPLILWWKLTRILPLRPSEFVLIKNDCLRHDLPNDKFYITVPRHKINDFIQKKLKEGNSNEIRITQEVYDLICEYKLLVGNNSKYLLNYESYVTSVNHKHSAQAKSNKYNKELFWTQQLYDLLNKFYVEIIDEHYQYTPVKKGDGDKIPFSIEKVHLGDTRHFAICSMMLQGYNPLTIARLAGHTDVNTQFNYLGHLDTFVDANVLTLARQIEQSIRNKEKAFNVYNTVFNTRESILQNMILEKTNSTEHLIEIDDGYCTSRNFPYECPPNTECIMCPMFIAKGNDESFLSKKTSELNKRLENELSKQVSVLKELFKKYKTTKHLDNELSSVSEQLSRAVGRKSVAKAYDLKMKGIEHSD